jgi:diguanylate cyclase (GGDEF)-like protein
VGIGHVLAGFGAGLVVSRIWYKAAQRHPRHALDTLTLVPTRGAAQRALHGLRDGDAVVMLDLDELKATNDAFGHGAGDELLVKVAAHLQRSVRAGDVVARWGGDEFVIVLRGGGEAAVDVVERLRTSAPAQCSAGVSVHRGGDGTATLAAADAALLAAKRAGGRRVVSG